MELEKVKEIISGKLSELEPLFVKGMKLTFIARYPGQSETELVITEDDLDDVIETLRRSKSREFRN